MPDITIKQVNGTKGRGVFANSTIKSGTVIDIGHVIIVSDTEYEHIKNTIVDDYIFEWDSDGSVAICMSPCEFCNHSYHPNAGYQHNYENRTIIFRAISDIKKGEEITVNYNGKVDDMSPVWFNVEEPGHESDS